MRTKTLVKDVFPPDALVPMNQQQLEPSSVGTVLAPRQTELKVLTSAQQIVLGVIGLASEIGEAAKKAAFSIGFGVLALGAILFVAEQHARAGSSSVHLLATGAFFTCAAIGRILDRKLSL